MKLKRVVLAGTLIATFAAVAAAPSYAEEPAPTEPPSPAVVWPNGGTKSSVFIYADTVTAASGAVKADRVCMQTNFFKRGQRVVFRVSAFDALKKLPLTAKTVKYMYVKVPGQPNQGPFKFSRHGREATSPWFWAAGWNIPDTYPLGVVDFQIVVKTKANNFGYFKQAAVAAAQLTIVP